MTDAFEADQLALVRRLRETNATLEQDLAALKQAGVSGTSRSMSDDALIDAKIAAAEARTETKFGALLHKLESMDGKLTRIEADNIRTRSTVRTSSFAVVSIIVAVLGLLFATFTQSFNLGSRVSEIARSEVARAQPTTSAKP